jgi:hypothetical protein
MSRLGRLSSPPPRIFIEGARKVGGSESGEGSGSGKSVKK